MKKLNRFISIILLTCMVLTLVPSKALADEPDTLGAAANKEVQTVNNDKSTQGKIIGEITEKRERNVKYFIKDDGKFEAAVYNEPVHYFSEGKWKDIDNTFIQGKDEENEDVLQNKENDCKVKIAQNTKTKRLVRVQKDKYELSWGMDNVNIVNSKVKDKKEPENLSQNESKRNLNNISSAIEFLNIYPDVDLQYIVKSNMVKENIVINKKLESSKFTFRINVEELIPKLDKDNSIVFYDKEDTSKAIFKMEAPFMKDGKGEESSDIHIDLKEDKEEYILTITPNEQWLNSENRTYPVTIDPPVRTSLNVNDIKDTFVCSIDTENKYQNQLLRVGATPQVGTTRTYIKFTLPNNITSADTVTGATLGLLQCESNNGGGQVNVHKVEADWQPESLLWSNKPNYNINIEDYVPENRTNGSWIQWDISKIVKEWYKTGKNYGLMLKSNDESKGDTAFYSSDWGDQYSSIRPQVIINYVNNSGLESYWTYHSQNAGRAGNGYINDYNGNLVFVHDDLIMNGSKMPITLKHVFNSNERNNSIGYGLGWRLNLYQRVDPKTFDGEQWYVYTDEDGTKHYFQYDSSSNTYKDKSGIDLTLTKNADGSYTIKDKNDEELQFNVWGYLVSIKDKNGNTISLSYSGAALKTIKDGAGRTTTLDILSNGYLVGITDPSGRSTRFAYNGIQLSRITYPDNKYSVFNYDTDNKLISVVNFDGYKQVYSYNSQTPYPVSKVQEYGSDGTAGKSLSIDYGYNTTTFTQPLKDNTVRKSIYQFNDYGNTISVKDDEGNAKYYKYDMDSNINKLTVESKLQKFTTNYLKNHNAELTTDWQPGAWSNSLGQSTFAQGNAYIGNGCLQVTKNNTISRHYFEQTLNLTKGKTYTFSAYAKVSNISNGNGKGAALFINYQDNAGNWQTVESNYINGNKEWERAEVKFQLPEDAASNNVYIRAGIIEESGTAYFDCLQLEDGNIANRYNIVENADLRYGGEAPSLWNKTLDCDANDKAVTVDGKLAFRINGNGIKDKGVYEKINVSGKKGDIFSLGAWAKGSSVPLRDKRYFAIDLGIERLDGTYKWTVVSFNGDTADWQYVSDKVEADADYKSVTFYALYYKNLNTAYFTNFQLYKEEFGQSYGYDSKGNLTSTVDLAKNKSEFKYNEKNDLVQAVDPKGGAFNYEYDGKHNMTKASSAENVVYSFTYDSYGNPLTAKVGNDSLFMESGAKYTASGNYISELTDASGKPVKYSYDEQKGVLNSFTDSKEKVTNYIYDDLDRITDVYKNAGTQEIRNTYTYENDKIKSVGHNGFNYNFGYDAYGNNSDVYVGNQKLITNSYDESNGNLLQSEYGNGNKVTNVYDRWDRVISRNFDGVEKFKYEYDSAGNLGYHEDKENGISYRYIYDMANRLVKVEDSDKNSIKYDFDNNNNLSIFQDTIKGIPYVTKYMYDKDNKLKGINYYRSGINNSKIEYFPLNGSLAGSNGSRPFSENAEFETNDKGNNALAAYESSTNLAANSSFENSMTSWSTSDWNGLSGKWRVVYDGVKGTQSLEAYDSDGLNDGSTTNPVAYQYVNFTTALAESKAYTLSAYAKRTGSTQPSLSIKCYDANDKEIYYNIQNKEILENKWTRISHTFTLPQGTKKVMIIIRSMVKDKDVVRFDNVQFEEKDFPTFYTEGTSQGAKILYNLGVNKNSGTMSTWFTTVTTGTTRHVLANQKDTLQLMNIYIDSNNYLNLSVIDNGSFRNLITSTDTIEKNTPYFTAISWNMEGTNLKCKLYLNDKLVGEGTLVNPADITGGTTALGSSIGGSQQLNGTLQQFTYSKETLSDEEIKALFASGKDSSTSSLTLDYDILGRINSRTLNTESFSFNTSYTYEAGSKTNSTTNRISAINNNGEKIDYTYDDNGNIETITYNKGTDKEKNIKYEYNELNEIIREDNQLIDKTIKYTYDMGGNITKKEEFPYTLGDTSTPVKVYDYKYEDTNWKDKLTSFDGKTITYDAIGNPLTYDNWNFTWERGRQLKSMTKDGTSLSFKYNDAGIRTEKTVNGVATKYHLVGDKVTYEDNGVDKIYYTYDSNSNLVSMNLNGVEYYYIRNAQGDIIGLFDKTGAQVVSYTYDSWGKLVSIDGTLKDTVGVKNPYRYRGYRYDSETRLYYLQSRYYNPEWGRFINADGIAGNVGELLGHNVFAYCKNNVANMSDPSGFRPAFDNEVTQEKYEDWKWKKHNPQANISNVKNNYVITKKESSDMGKNAVKGAGTGCAGYLTAGLSKDSKLVLNRQMRRSGEYFVIPGSRLAKGIGTGLAIYGVVDTISSIASDWKDSRSWQERTGKITIDVAVFIIPMAVGGPVAGVVTGIIADNAGAFIKKRVWDN